MMSNGPRGRNQARRRSRAASIRRLNRYQRWIGVTLISLTTPSAIAAIVIGDTYTMQTSPCFDATQYIIAPKRYLLIAGIIQLVFGIFYAIGQCFKAKRWLNSLNGLTGCLTLFYLTWAIIGSIMYYQQFNDQCKDESIAKMILSWCIINISVIILTIGIFCIICFIPIGDNNNSQRRGQRERDPLLQSVQVICCMFVSHNFVSLLSFILYFGLFWWLCLKMDSV